MNAVHGSSNKEHADKTIAMVFGEVEFNEDGTIKGTLIENERKSKEPLHAHTHTTIKTYPYFICLSTL